MTFTLAGTRLTPIGATFSTNLSSWLLAVPGSPSNKRLMSPLLVRPSGNLFRDPPISRHAIAFLISILPYMEGEIDLGGGVNLQATPTSDWLTWRPPRRYLVVKQVSEAPPPLRRSKVAHWLCRAHHCRPLFPLLSSMVSSDLHC